MLWSTADDSKSSDLVACTRRASEGFQVGHWEGDDSHEGPYLHNVESANCWAVNPRVRRSAGL